MRKDVVELDAFSLGEEEREIKEGCNSFQY